MPPIPPTGWFVAVTHSSGYTHYPRVVGTPQRKPRVNARPSMQVPVPKAERWLGDAGFRGADAKVWFDGERQPVDELVEPIESEDGVTLNLTGGTELRDTRVRLEVSAEAAHDVAETIINQTSYAGDVDALADSLVDTGVLVQDVDSATEWGVVVSPPIDSPAYLTGAGELESYQTCWFQEGEDLDSGQTGADDGSSDTEISGNDYASLSRGPSAGGPDYAIWPFTVNYGPIPASAFEVYIRHASNYDGSSSSGVPELTWYLDLEDGRTITLDENDFLGAGFQDNFSWEQLPDFAGSPPETVPDIPAGDHELRVEIDNSDGIIDAYQYWIDCIAPVDTRWGNDFSDETTDANDALSGPSLYPDAVEVEIQDAETAYAIAAAELDVTASATDHGFAVALSNDFGSTWTTASNTTTLDADFASVGPAVRARLTIGRSGSGAATTPTEGYDTHTVDAFEVRADLDETPFVVDQTFDGSAEEVLAQIASSADALWEYRRTAAGPTVVWTYPGQRAADGDPAVSRFRASESIEEQYDKVVVKGDLRRTQAEAVTADHGTAVALEHDDFAKGKEVVVDASTGQQYSPGSDYELDALDGEITVLAVGDIEDGASLEVTYDWHPSGSAPQNPPSGGRTLVRTIPGLSTSRGCGQAAIRLYRELKDASQAGEVVIPHDQAGWSVVESIDPDVFPDRFGAIEIRGVDSQPGQTTLRVGGKSAREEVQALRDRVSSIAGRV